MQQARLWLSPIPEMALDFGETLISLRCPEADELALAHVVDLARFGQLRTGQEQDRGRDAGGVGQGVGILARHGGGPHMGADRAG